MLLMSMRMGTSILTGANNLVPEKLVGTEVNSHVIEPFIDALALRAVLYRLNDELTLADNEKLLLAAAPELNRSSELNRSEEALTEALFKLFLPDTGFLSGRAGPEQTPQYEADRRPTSDATAGFWVGKGAIRARDAFHDAVLRIEQAVQGRGYQLLSLADASAQALRVFTLSPDGIAFRYALKALNPFAVTGVDYTPHNQNGELQVYDPATGEGSLTDKWIEDRAEMLEVLMKRNTQDTNFAPYPADKIYSDATRRIVLRPENSGHVADALQKQIRFGSAQGESLQGGNLADHLYGGEGKDHLSGKAGNDYLQGDKGDDLIHGGDQDDILIGGKGNDVLDGGLGNDTCEWRKGEGFDTILDACEGGDGAKAGVIEFLGQSVAGTKAQLQPDNFNLCTNIKPGEPGNRKSHRSASGTDARLETNDRKAA